MPSPKGELQVAIDWVFGSGSVGISRYRCHGGVGAGGEQRQATHVIAFPHRGAFVVHAKGETALIEPNTMLFLNGDEPYRTSHPFGCGDSGSALALRDDVAREAMRLVDPEAADDPRGPFRATHASCPKDVYVLERLLLHRAAAGFESNGMEETALHLVAKALGVLPNALAARPRRAAARDRDVVERVKGLLCLDLEGATPLSTLARAVSLSVFHLCRLFKRRTGTTLHAYRNRLRLHASLEEVAGSTRELAGVALEFGFSSHSHFSAAFRREFGLSPADLRRRARAAGGRALSIRTVRARS